MAFELYSRTGSSVSAICEVFEPIRLRALGDRREKRTVHVPSGFSSYPLRGNLPIHAFAATRGFAQCVPPATMPGSVCLSTLEVAMKSVLPVLLTAGLAVTWLGCGSATDSNPPTTAGGDVDAANLTLVTLDVPNMT
jgi:hypothetical protein